MLWVDGVCEEEGPVIVGDGGAGVHDAETVDDLRCRFFSSRNRRMAERSSHAMDASGKSEPKKSTPNV